jgi:hypothetical protein
VHVLTEDLKEHEAELQRAKSNLSEHRRQERLSNRNGKFTTPDNFPSNPLSGNLDRIKLPKAAITNVEMINSNPPKGLKKIGDRVMFSNAFKKKVRIDAGDSNTDFAESPASKAKSKSKEKKFQGRSQENFDVPMSPTLKSTNQIPSLENLDIFESRPKRRKDTMNTLRGTLLFDTGKSLAASLIVNGHSESGPDSPQKLTRVKSRDKSVTGITKSSEKTNAIRNARRQSTLAILETALPCLIFAEGDAERSEQDNCMKLLNSNQNFNLIYNLCASKQIFTRTMMAMNESRISNFYNLLNECHQETLELLKSSRRIRGIFDAAPQISASATIEEAMQAVVEFICGSLNCERATVYAVDRINFELWSKVAKGNFLFIKAQIRLLKFQ